MIDKCKIDKSKKYNVFAYIQDKRGRIVSTGQNKYKTHPKQSRFAKRAGKAKKICLHAEIDALIKCKHKAETMIVIRLLKDGSLALSKPCKVCMLAIRESTIKTVLYSTNCGNFHKITL